MTENPQSNSDELPTAQPEPSMGPACLVVVVLALAGTIAVCSIASFLVFRDQSALAARSITELLIPWIETSNLPVDAKEQILLDVSEVLQRVRARELSSHQLTRLRTVLEDNPVLLWGNVKGLLDRAPEAGLSDVELDAAKRVEQRLLRSAAMRKLGRNDLVFMLEPCAHTRPDGQGLELNENLTPESIRAFLSRAEKFVDGTQVPNEPFEKSVPEVFRGLLDEALSVESAGRR